MKIQRTLPPSAAPVYLNNLLHGANGIFWGERYIKNLEGEIKTYFGIKHAFFVSSGKAALYLILKALKSLSPDKSEVLIPAYTCFSVPSAVVKAGLKVSLSDIDISTYDFNYELLKKSINENTLCVVPNHLFGIPSDLELTKNLCGEKGIFVVEDAAQAMGGECRNKKLGTLSDVGFFSLGRGKNITCGSGGIILTDSDSIASAIRKEYESIPAPNMVENIIEFFKVFLLTLFIKPSLYWFPAGLKFLKLGETFFYTDFPIKRLSGMKAGILWNWRKRLEVSNMARSINAGYFSSKLKLEKGPASIKGVSFLRLPVLTDSRSERGQLHALSQKRGLGFSKMYPTPINEIKEMRGYFSGKSFPAAKMICERLITFPTHPFLTEKDRESIYHLSRGTIPERAGMDRATVGTGA